MQDKRLTERLEIRLEKEHRRMIKDISKKLKTKNTSKIIRICICDYWEKI